MSGTEATPPVGGPDEDTAWLPVPPGGDGPVAPVSGAGRGPGYAAPTDPRQAVQPWDPAPSDPAPSCPAPSDPAPSARQPTRVPARPLVGPGTRPPPVHPGAQVFVHQQLLVHAPPMKSTGVAYLFLLLLGGLGAHQFYIGKPGRAVFYLLTFFGVFGIMPVVDLFTLPSQVRQVNTQRAVLGR